MSTDLSSGYVEDFMVKLRLKAMGDACRVSVTPSPVLLNHESVRRFCFKALDDIS